MIITIINGRTRCISEEAYNEYIQQKEVEKERFFKEIKQFLIWLGFCILWVLYGAVNLGVFK